MNFNPTLNLVDDMTSYSSYSSFKTFPVTDLASSEFPSEDISKWGKDNLVDCNAGNLICNPLNKKSEVFTNITLSGKTLNRFSRFSLVEVIYSINVNQHTHVSNLTKVAAKSTYQPLLSTYWMPSSNNGSLNWKASANRESSICTCARVHIFKVWISLSTITSLSEDLINIFCLEKTKIELLRPCMENKKNYK